MSLVAYDSSDDNDSDVEQVETPSSSDDLTTKASLFQSLPAPRSREVIEEVNDTFIKIANDLEGDSDPNKLLRSTLLLPPPTARGATKSRNDKVKIGVPALSTFDSDDEDKPREKKPKLEPQQGKSGLFSFLPPPKTTASGKITNCTFVPYTLTKTKDSGKPKAVPKKSPRPPVHANATNDDSDEELESSDTPLNFFSIGDRKDNILASVDADPSVMEHVASTVPVTHGIVTNSAPETLPMDVSDEQFESPVMGATLPDESTVPNSQPLEINDEILLKLQGKRRHKQEEINIIDVSEDDQLSQTQEWLVKSLTEEKASTGHRYRAPTSQQRRKHQITYLAFQAKERELELKNQWAQNRLTRRQTQSKYGF